MKSTDRVLIGIVAGIVLLIVVALVIILAKPDPTYQAENTPEGVAHNYLLALQREEYDRAYGYLSPSLSGYPKTQEKFVDDIHDSPWRFRLNTSTTQSIQSANTTGDSAIVTVRETRFRGGDLFDSGQSSYLVDMELRLEDGGWKIVDAPYYFASCWTWDDGCR